jgi:hypothetical protein
MLHLLQVNTTHYSQQLPYNPIASRYTAVLDTTLESLLVYVYIRRSLACLINVSVHEST